MDFFNDRPFAQSMDQKDPLKSFKGEFIFPKKLGENPIYLVGNSLGLQPKKTQAAIHQELEDWGAWGVEGHFKAKNPWLSYHEMFAPTLAYIAGAKTSEVVAMNSLTANLHFLMASFYTPKGKRTKILMESKAFPSDTYALESQIKWHGLHPKDHLVKIPTDPTTGLIDENLVLKIIADLGSELALIMMGGVNYYTGQLFDIKSITEAGHKAGALVGFDLAHAFGNVTLQLHQWNVDFAAWCSYKYLNAGPGSTAGAFVHQKHHNNKDITRLAGWWGHDKTTRFLMDDAFLPIESAEAWQVSNAPVLSLAAQKASLDIFQKAGIENIRKKSVLLTAYLEYILQEVSKNTALDFKIITPKDPEKRGAQLSVLSLNSGKELYRYLMQNGVVVDWREPNVIRMAPAPLYVGFEDIWRLGHILRQYQNNN